jgi:hypothetical protein
MSERWIKLRNPKYTRLLPYASRSVPPACQAAGENTQLKGRIRRSFALDALPRQPQVGLEQESISSPNIFIASAAESDAFVHFFCKLMGWPLGHSKTI